MWMVVLVIVGLAIVFLVFAPALTTKLPTELPISLPTEMKIAMPEIKFPEITFPEIPDPTKALEGFVAKIPTLDDVKDAVKETVAPIIDVIPTLDEVKETIVDITPDVIKDPSGWMYEHRVEERLAPWPTLREVGETVDNVIVKPVTGLVEAVTTEPEFVPPTLPSIEPEKTTVNVISDALTGLGQAIDQNITQPITQILPTAKPKVFDRIVRGH